MKRYAIKTARLDSMIGRLQLAALSLLLGTLPDLALAQNTDKNLNCAIYDRKTGQKSGCAEGPFSIRVTNGELAKAHIMTVAVHYYVFRNQKPISKLCTGVFLPPHHVLTAGHCGCGAVSTYTVHFKQDFKVPRSPAEPVELNHAVRVNGAPIMLKPRICTGAELRGGDLALLRIPDVAKQRPEAKKSGRAVPGQIGITEKYDTLLTRYMGEDIAQLQYLNAADTLETQRRWMAPGNSLIAVGYGLTENQSFGQRMKAAIPIFSVDCAQRGLWESCAPFREMILADRGRNLREAKDTCSGDSGGPVFAVEQRRNKEGEIISVDRLIAITSRAAPGQHADVTNHCGGGGIYTLIGTRRVQNWLAANGVQLPTGDTPLFSASIGQ